MTAQEKMTQAVRRLMAEQGISQAELARRTGRTTKHVNKVLGGSAGTRELDYWLFVLGYQFVVTIEAVTPPEESQPWS
jgi:transcriptional regulator with XRE-family HTH domain